MKIWKHLAVTIAAFVGAFLGFVSIFVVSTAVNLFTDLTPIAKVVVYSISPFTKLMGLFEGAWILVVLVNAILYVGVTIIIRRCWRGLSKG